MEMILLNVNNPSASIITFFRLIPENSKGVMGADIATTSANICLLYTSDAADEL